MRLDTGYALLWDNTHERIEQSDCKLEFFTNNGQAMTLSASNLGIGTSAPDDLLHVYSGNSGAAPHSTSLVNIESAGTATLSFLTTSSYDGQIRWADESDDGKGIIAYNHNGDYMLFCTNGPEKMRITSGGLVGIGETDPDQLLHIKSAAPVLRIEDSDGGYADIEVDGGTVKLRADQSDAVGSSEISFWVDGGEKATITAAGAMTVVGDVTASTSDSRFKINKGKITNALDKVCSLTGFYYTWNDLAKSKNCL